MNAMRMATATPYLDAAILAVENLAEDLAWNPDDEFCADCKGAVTGWCDMHEARQVEADKYERVLLALYAAGTDDEARAVMAGLLNQVAALLPGTEKAA